MTYRVNTLKILFVASLFISLCGCAGSAAPAKAAVPAEVSPLVGYRESTSVTVSDNRLTGNWDAGFRLDLIDLQDQFYPLSELEVTVPDSMGQQAYCVDGNETVVETKELVSGPNRLAPADGVRYLVFPMAAGDKDKLRYVGFPSGNAASERKGEPLVSQALNGKRLSVLGDSLSSAVDYSPDGSYGVYPLADADVTDLWWYQIARDFQMEICYINAYGGSGVMDRMGRVETAAGPGRRGRLLSANGMDPEVIIVWIGANDILQGEPADSVEAAYRMMLDDIKECYPNASLYLTTYYVLQSEPLKQLNQMIRGLGEEYGARILDLENCGIDSSSDLADGSHPNKKGCGIITKCMEEQLLKS